MKMYEGPLIRKMITFSIPLMITGILQLLYNAADIIVVGRYAGTDALSAVGATGSLINLIVSLFMGLSLGTTVMVSRFHAAKSNENLTQTVHTSILLALISGVIIAIIGVVLAEPILTEMNVPENVIDGATTYMQIYCMGMPFAMLYNFAASVLRAVGNTRQPLYYLTFSGIINIVLNFIFVVYFNMSVAGVAYATVISQFVSTVLVLRCLARQTGPLKLEFKKLKIHKDKLLDLAKIGLPAGFQGMLFSISNAIIQSSINSFGSIAMAGNAAACNIEGFILRTMHAVHETDVAFSSQCIGAKQYKRSALVLRYSLVYVTAIGVVMGLVFYLLKTPLLGLYNSDPAVIAIGAKRMFYHCYFYFFAGLMNVMAGHLRSMGSSFAPMIISFAGICFFRTAWIYTIFAMYPNLDVLYISYPISWAVTAFSHMLLYMKLKRKFPKEDKPL